LFITNDLLMVKYFGTRVAVMYLGVVCKLTDTKTLFANPHQPYMQLLLIAIPKWMGLNHCICATMGKVPSAMDLPTGCVFHGRCLLAKEVRETDIPPFV
jgi:peptide/nickel transport system ATP-binding protein